MSRVRISSRSSGAIWGSWPRSILAELSRRRRRFGCDPSGRSPITSGRVPLRLRRSTASLARTIAELKGEFALAVVPTKHYGANSAWQQLSVLAYNVARSFQLDTGAAPRRRSRKRTYTYVLRSMRTLRFTLVARAGRLARIGGRQALRPTFNPATAALYTRLEQHLAA